MDEALVQVEQLSFSFRRGRLVQPILHDLTLSLAPGEVVVLTGPSGSGKSTLLTIMGGLRRAGEGSAQVLGEQVIGAAERKLVALRRRIGFIFQQHNLAPALSVFQNIKMGLQLSGGHRGRDSAERIRAAAAAVGMEDHLGKRPSQLSGGQQQRVGIARALVNEPKLVLADEPTASLDRVSGELVMRCFEKLAENGGAVVLVTHDRRIIDQADRILSMEDGRLVPQVEQLSRDAANSLRTLEQVDPVRLGRMLSFGHALARVALADGRVDPQEREAMVAALSRRRVFSGHEVDLVVDLALAQARAWQRAGVEKSEGDLADALEEVAAADSVVTDRERAVIRELLRDSGQ